ncbi:MAG: NAD(P)H-quinone oxidoreductase [Gemmatimonadetes bacterium]|nr:MAG: NAD(P)H-quinone oxidoreductase [Gemmatimonadota bacterium]
MRAILVKAPGGADQLEMGEFPAPVPADDEVLVEVKATALNRADIMQREGKYPPPAGASPILGLEMAGVVQQVGNACRRAKKGDRVCALLPGGGYAEYVAVPESMLIPIPANLSFEEAAGIPEVFMTAYQALFWVGNLQPGETVLIHAGASGVGTAAIQLAKDAGASVIITAGSDEKTNFCRHLGADYAINYKTGDFASSVLDVTENHGVNLVIDVVGAAYWAQNITALGMDGRWVCLAMMGGSKIPDFDLRHLFRKRIQLLTTTLRSRSQAYKQDLTQELVFHLLPKFEKELLKPVIDTVFSWSDVAEAHRYMEANQNRGKIVLRIEDTESSM